MDHDRNGAEMKPPTLAPTILEQAVFAWTTRTVSNVKGEGYAAVSDGLTRAVPWLESIDVDHFRLLDRGIPGTAEAYTEWREFASVGYLRLGNVGIAYRKMAKGGIDDMKRYRHVVHLIVGSAAEVNLSFALLLAEDDWMAVESCPVGMPMKLPQINLHDLRFAVSRVEHDCARADMVSRNLVERLIDDRVGSRTQLGSDELELLPAIAHSAIPEACRTTLALDCFVGASGPVGYLQIGESANTDGGLRRELEVALGEALASCALYQELSPGWQNLPNGERAWSAYAAQLHGTAVTAGADSEKDEASVAADLGTFSQAVSPSLSKAQKLLINVRIQRPIESVVDLELNEDEALAFLWRCQKDGVAGPDVLNLTYWSLREIFGLVKSSKGYRAVLDFMQSSDHDLITRKWRETGLGVLGYVALQKWSTEADDRADAALLPDRRLLEQLKVLVGHLITNEDGIQKLSILLRHGFASEREFRRLYLDSLGDRGRRFLYSTIVPNAGLPTDQLLDFIRESFGDWCSFYHIPDDQAEAIRSALFRRRHQIMDTLLRRRPDPA